MLTVGVGGMKQHCSKEFGMSLRSIGFSDNQDNELANGNKFHAAVITDNLFNIWQIKSLEF